MIEVMARFISSLNDIMEERFEINETKVSETEIMKQEVRELINKIVQIKNLKNDIAYQRNTAK
jgi:hypothetical protein